MKGNPKEVRETLLKYIPLESSQLYAKRIMEENEFSCTQILKGEFLENKNIDYLYCDRYDKESFLISRRWQIAIILNRSRVKDIQVSTGLVGP